jgi:hypothetical protein
MNYDQTYALKQADPKYTAFDQKIRDAHQEKRRINTKQCIAMREVCQLNHALDLVRQKSWDFESTPAKTDKILDEATGSDGEGWFWTYHNAGEEIEKTMIQKCIKVANLAVNYDVCSERISALIAKQKEYGDKLVQQHKEKEATA